MYGCLTILFNSLIWFPFLTNIYLNVYLYGPVGANVQVDMQTSIQWVSSPNRLIHKIMLLHADKYS
jgi:hypothetical protein